MQIEPFLLLAPVAFADAIVAIGYIARHRDETVERAREKGEEIASSKGREGGSNRSISIFPPASLALLAFDIARAHAVLLV